MSATEVAVPPLAIEVLPPSGPRAPLVAHVPHASTVIPDDVRSELLVSDEELAGEVLRLTDWHTDELFAGLTEVGATVFIDRLSRLVFDPERFLDDRAEPMASRGQGVVYLTGSRLQPLREASPHLRARRIEQLYRPYHAALDELVHESLVAFGACTVVDGHSFATEPLPSEIDQTPGRPDICIGTDPVHTPAALAEALEAGFREAGLRVRRDSPFAGTFVPAGYYRREPRVHSVMIEVRRGLYIDETDARQLPAFAEVEATIRRVVGGALVG